MMSKHQLLDLLHKIISPTTNSKIKKTSLTQVLVLITSLAPSYGALPAVTLSILNNSQKLMLIQEKQTKWSLTICNIDSWGKGGDMTFLQKN